MIKHRRAQTILPLKSLWTLFHWSEWKSTLSPAADDRRALEDKSSRWALILRTPAVGPNKDINKKITKRQMQPNEVPTFKASIEKWRDHSVSKRSHVQHCALRRDDLKRVGPAWVNHRGLCSGRKLGWEKKISAESNIQLKHVGQRPVTVQAWMRRSTVNH